MKRRRISVLLPIALFQVCVALFWAGETAPGTCVSAESFNKLVDDYFDYYFKHNPTAATAAGVHDFDRQLEDYSKAEIDAQIVAFTEFGRKFANSEPGSRDSYAAGDRELIIHNIEATLLELQQIRSWEKNPDRYSSGITQSVFGIMSRNFASAAERLESVIARERQMPQVFVEARANLKKPPRIYTEVSLEQMPGIISFFEKDVPTAFAEVKDSKLLDEFNARNHAVITALSHYRDFLKDELLPHADGDFRIGAENFRKMLVAEEMVDIPLDRLLAIGFENLRTNQMAFKTTATKLDPQRTPTEILADLEKDHPAPDKLLASFRDVLDGLRQFITDHKIATIPSPVPPIVQETPPFMRALTFASMDTPGPFEAVAKEAFFNVTLPESSWPKEQVEEHMAGFNRGTIISTAIHEAYPGHYIQFLWLRQAPSKARKLLGASSNAEGWAHYTEQMMLDEGYGNGDLKLRLGQLQDALLRNARFIVGIQMHTGKMTYEEGIDFFAKEGFQSRANAERETRRGTSDPTYLVYTLGKLEILKLREDYKKMRGDKFTLQEFHDSLLKQGFPPVRLLRRTMLGDDGPVL